MTGQQYSAALAGQILDRFRKRQTDLESFMRALVEIESPSGDLAGSREVVAALGTAGAGVNGVDEIERVEVPNFGQHLVIKAFQQQSNAGQVLIVGHTDTVHSRGSLAERPWRREGERLYGPGVFDMKANCALVIEVLRTLSGVGARRRL